MHLGLSTCTESWKGGRRTAGGSSMTRFRWHCMQRGAMHDFQATGMYYPQIALVKHRQGRVCKWCLLWTALSMQYMCTAHTLCNPKLQRGHSRRQCGELATAAQLLQVVPQQLGATVGQRQHGDAGKRQVGSLGLKRKGTQLRTRAWYVHMPCSCLTCISLAKTQAP